MVKQMVEDLKGRPKDEKTAVAGGAAVLVVTILFLAWGFFFFKKIARGGDVSVPFGGVQTDVVQGASLQQAEDDFLKSYNDASSELRTIRDQSAQNAAYSSSQSADFNSDSFSSGASSDSGFGF